MDQNRNKSPFNTRNDAVAIFSPGQNITVPGSPKKLSGTSFAVPFASGLLALELSRMRQDNPKARLSKQEAITFLRGVLGLSCETHTYANDVCLGLHRGGAFEAQEGDGPIWLFILAFGSGAIALWLTQIARYTAA